MVRSLYCLAAGSALALLAAETGSGGGSSKKSADDVATPNAEFTALEAALSAMTVERDEALAAGKTAIEELVAKLDEMTAASTVTAEEIAKAFADKAAEHEALLLKLDNLTRDLADANETIAELEEERDSLAARLDVPGRPAAAPRYATDHFVLLTSRMSDSDGQSLARGRVVTMSPKKADKHVPAGKVRKATVAEVENARQPIVAL